MLQRLTFTADLGYGKGGVSIVKLRRLRDPRAVVESLPRGRGIVVQRSNSSGDQRVVIASLWRFWAGAHALKIGLSIDPAIRPPRTAELPIAPVFKAELPATVLQPAYFSWQQLEWHARTPNARP
jgi:hypothetical protein